MGSNGPRGDGEPHPAGIQDAGGEPDRRVPQGRMAGFGSIPPPGFGVQHRTCVRVYSESVEPLAVVPNGPDPDPDLPQPSVTPAS
jgi:hypothetical protein